MTGRALTRELSCDGADRWLRRCSRARLSLLCVAIIAQQAAAFIVRSRWRGCGCNVAHRTADLGPPALLP